MFHYPKEDPQNAGKVLYSEFTIDGRRMIAMDGPGKHDYNFNEGISLFVNCETQKEIDHFWNKLIENGGEESRCGWLKDKFGVSWQIVPTALGKLMGDPEKGKRVMQAVMQMKKLDIETLEKA